MKLKIVNQKTNIKIFESIYKNRKKQLNNLAILKSKNKIFTNKYVLINKNIDINKIVVYNKVSFSKKGFKYFIGYKNVKKLDLYVYFSQK